MLKSKYDSKADIPNGAENFYAEKDGVFVLQAESVKAEESVAALELAAEKERGFRREAEKTAKELKAKYSFLPDEFDADELARLNDTSQGDVDERLKKQRETLTAQHAREKEALTATIAEKDDLVQKHVVDASLLKAISENNIAPQYIPAAKAILKPRIKLEGSDVFLDEKPIGDAMKAWSESKEGSIYLAADGSNGGGADNAKPNAKEAVVKTVKRSEYNAMDHAERAAFGKEKGKITD